MKPASARKARCRISGRLRGSRPPAVRDNRHDSAYLFGAICPARAVGAAIVTPWVNSEAMTIHLAEIAKQVAPAHMPCWSATAPAGIRRDSA